jgi:hypothetical protein
MKLQMKELDIDTYNATFERLASAAEWEADAKGTIARYRAGLRENVHRRVVNRENLPTTMNNGRRPREKRSAGSKSYKAQDSSVPAETSHVTSTRTKPGTNTRPIPRRTTNTFQWT